MAFQLGAVYFGNTILNYLSFFLVIAGALIIGKALTWSSKKFLQAFAYKTETKADDILLSLLERPVLFSIFIVALYLGQHILSMSATIGSIYDKTIKVLIIINLAWYLIKFLDGVTNHYITPLTSRTKSDLDNNVLPIIKRLLNVVIVAIAIIIVVDQFGYNVGSLIAGLGIGGLAFALAAQDLLGNLFGGMAILIDKPFKFGDHIKVGNDVNGFVRDIGLRTTRIETFDGTQVILPNSKVVNSITENITREKKRRMKIVLGLEYDTSSEKLEEGKRIIAKSIKKVSGLDHEDFTVIFSEFADSSLNIKVIYWITKSGMGRYWEVQDELLTDIKREFEKAKIEFAFPTQTIHVKK